MTAIFCCNDVSPFKPTRTDHEAKFDSFLHWAKSSTSTSALDNEAAVCLDDPSSYAIQVVRQVNYGPVEFKRYFGVSTKGDFIELTEKALINSNFEKLNSYKNFRCAQHNKFFELNLYKKDPVNKHHWRANIARPATEIDLPVKS